MSWSLASTPRLAITTVLAISLVLSACGRSKASTCAEYAADLREVIAETTTPEEIRDFLTDTEDEVAGLLLETQGGADAQPCADAITEALAVIAERGFAQLGN